MSTHKIHSEKDSFYFVTFTCYKWLTLIDETALYDYIPISFAELRKRHVNICGFVIMPNHIHLLLFVDEKCKDFNTVIGETKRFMAYEIVKRLKLANRTQILKLLSDGVQDNEKKIGKKHQVFRLSFDAKQISNERQIQTILDYMHKNPVQGKWNLVSDFTTYKYSSASHYELNETPFFEIIDYRDIVIG